MAATGQYSPFITWDFTTLTTTFPYQQVNPLKMRNTTDTPAYIDEIRFLTQYPVDPRAFVLVNLRMGNGTPLTRDYTPMWLLGSEFNRKLVANPILSLATATSAYVYQQRFRLARPILLAPQDDIVIELKLDTNFFAYLDTTIRTLGRENADITIQTGLIGRSLPSNIEWPLKNDYPFVSFYRSPFFTFGTLTEYTTTLADLQNPFQEELQIEKFVGRMFVTSYDSYDINAVDPNEVAVTWKLTDNRGKIIIRDFSNFAEIFHSSDSSWWNKTTMPPKSFYVGKLRVDTRAYAAGNAWPAYSSLVSPSLFDTAIIGYRSVDLAGQTNAYAAPPTDR